MSARTKPRRHLRFEPLEPRWTMDAQLCAMGPVNPASEVCATAVTAAPAWQTEIQLVEQSLNQFAIDLYQVLLQANATEPIDTAISPFSIAAALAMTYAGAQGETASQLAHALHVDLPPDRFHAAMETILERMLPGASDNAVQLDIANALWGQSDFPLLDSFRQLLDQRYGAEFHEADFSTAPGDATAAINDWVRTQTHDMIDKLFDSLSSDTRLVLANALYFKASWERAFDSYSTHRTIFHLANGGSMDVAMMHNVAAFNYTESADYQIAELPYEGGRYSMVILLPKQSGGDLTADFSAADLQNWLAASHPAELSVALPKFKLETSLSLVDTLKSLGITDAFDAAKANFSGINGRRDLYIQQAVHKAVVEVNETGTEAAAATGISIGALGECVCAPPTPIPFYADHPFHFLVRDRQTDSILFLGQVQEPTHYVGNDPAAIELPKFSLGVTTNVANPFDVNADGQESTLDALLVINYLNGYASQFQANGESLALTGATFHGDVDVDGQVAPIDALLIINRLNERLSQATPSNDAAAEGESVLGSDRSNAQSAADAVFALNEDLAAYLPQQLATRPTTKA